MVPLQEQLADIEKEQEKLKNKNYQCYKLSKDITKLDNNIYYILYGIFVITLTTFHYTTLGYLSLWNFILILIGSFYPGVIAMVILAIVLSPVIVYFLHLYHKVSYKDYDKYRIADSDLLYRKRSIENKIIQEKRQLSKQTELKFVDKIKEFLVHLTYKSISLTEAKSIRAELENQHLKVRLSGYQVYNSYWYTNQFNKIDELLKNYEMATSKPQQQKAASRSIASSIITNKPTTITIPSTASTLLDHNGNTVPKPPNAKSTPSKYQAEDTYYNNSFTQQVQLESQNSTSEEKLLSELFPNIDTKNVNDRKERLLHTNSLKRDYLLLNEHRQRIGELGELFIIAREKDRLIRLNKNDLSEKVVHISKTDDSKGYDILSYFETGQPKFIEVKTTTENHKAPFYLSENELLIMKQLNNYFIYRVFNFNLDTGKGELFVIDCKSEISKYYNIEPVSYRISPKL